MLHIFRSNQPLLVLLLIVYALLLRGDTLMHPVTAGTDNAGLLSGLVYQWIGDKAVLQSILALLLVLVQAVILNGLVNQYRISREITYVTAICYILLASSSPSFSTLTPALMANTFVLLGLRELFAAYRSKEAMGFIFNVGFWLALASLFYFSACSYLILSLIALSLFRQPNFRESFVVLSGFVAVYFMLGVGFFWADNLGYFFWDLLFQHFRLPKFVGTIHLPEIIQATTMAVLLLWAVGNLAGVFFKANTQTQLYISVFYWMLLVTGLSVFCQNVVNLHHLQLLAVPLAVFLGLNLLLLRRKFSAEFIHLLLFMAVIANQYKEYFFEL